LEDLVPWRQNLRVPLASRTRWTTDPADRLRIERVLASARMGLASLSLAAIYLDASDPTYFASLAYALLVLYGGASVAILLFVRRRTTLPPWFPACIHAADVIWPALITTFTAGPNSPLFAFLTFALLAAAYRWGIREAMATAAFAAALLVYQGLAWRALGIEEAGDFPLNRLIIRITYVFIVAFLVGVLAEAEKRQRGEAAAVAHLAKLAQLDRGVRANLRRVLMELVRLLRARRADLVIRDEVTGRVVHWVVEDRGDGPQHVRPLTGAGAALLDPDLPQPLAAVSDPLGRRPPAVFTLDRSGRRVAVIQPRQPAGLTQPAQAGGALLSASYSDGADLRARVVLALPRFRDAESDLRLLHAIIQHVAPGLHNLYLLGRLRSRIGAVERARLARELHDGVIQSIIGLEMEVNVMRSQLGDNEAAATRLQRIQDLLRQEALTLRELMTRMRPLDLSHKDFVEFVAHTVDRFGRDTGIAASFASNIDDLLLPARTGRHLGRIVQEALFNIRRHSQARTAVVRLRVDGGTLTLLVDDDGRGFGSTGRLAGAELDRSARGPVTIKERARAIGAALAVESSPGTGSRIELRLPLSGAADAGSVASAVGAAEA
jgi:signal transduction histidine kinase